MEAILDLQHVTKRYGKRKVLKDISFSAAKGEIIALLGRNGTGKSTLMNIITGYLCQTSGDIKVCGQDVLLNPIEIRKQIGYLPEQPPLYPDMTVREYLHYCGQLRGLPRQEQKREAERVIELTGLKEYASRLSGRLSKGYKQRLGVAQALLGHPAVLILDEPGSGLDPLQMVQMRDVIRTAGEDSTILLSSHLLSEVTNVCHRAIVIDEGYVRYDGSVAELLHGSASIRLKYQGSRALAEQLAQLPFVTDVAFEVCDEANVQQITIHHEVGADLRAQVSSLCMSSGCNLLEITAAGALEDAFLHVIGQKEDA